MAGKTREEAEATREQILDAALQVFQAEGVSRATLAEVAKAAGVTRGAIYWHFQNKIDLFNSMLERVRLPLDELSRASENEDEPDPLGRLSELLVRVLTQIAEQPNVRRTMDILRYKCEYTGDLLALHAQMQCLSEDCDQRLTRALGNAVSRGQMPADLDCAQAAFSLHAYILGVENSWLLRPDFDLAARAPMLVESALDMLRHSPALRLADKA